MRGFTSMIDELRDACKECGPLLSTRAETADEEQTRKALRERFPIAAGFKKEEAEKMNPDEMSHGELQNAVMQRLVGMMTGSGANHRVTPVQEVRSCTGQGYECVASFPYGQAIVEVPS